MIADILIWLIAVLGAISGIFLGRFWGRVEGKHTDKQKAERDAMENTIERVERGHKALRDGRNTGDPAERMRKNDGKW